MPTCSNQFSKVLASAVFGAALATAGSAAAARANAEPLDLDVEILAKLAKERANTTAATRQVGNAGRREAQRGHQAAECGSIAIGNVIGSNRIGFGPTDVNVVIVGDVINANNTCR
ncbi:MAG: hypothetical protein N2688_02950 [Burkholderiaceae bacterium]|nr:hypothetical protein [Burkholderiaceae bacterium]